MAAIDLNDIEYDAYLANDRTLDDPEVVSVENGGRIRLRIINGATATAFTVDTGALTGQLIAVDGQSAPARAIDLELRPLYAALGAQSNPIPVKWLLQRLERLHGALRLPLHELAAEHRAAVDACLTDIHRCEATMRDAP